MPDSGWQIFVRDVLLGTTRLVSVAEDGTGADAGVALSFNYLIMGISTNGQVVAFLNDGLKLADGRPQLFVRSLATETTKLITVKYDGSACLFGCP